MMDTVSFLFGLGVGSLLCAVFTAIGVWAAREMRDFPPRDPPDETPPEPKPAPSSGRMQTDLKSGETPARQVRTMWD